MAVNVALPSEVELTVTVDAAPAHGDVAVGEVKLLTLGTALTVITIALEVAVGDVMHEFPVMETTILFPFARVLVV